jgi:hypothetical protein
MGLNLRASAACPSSISIPVVLSVCQAAAMAAELRQSTPHVGVLVRNFSDAPVEMIQSAEAACRKIFDHAGIRITWLNTLDQVTWRGPDLVLDAAILSQPPTSPVGTFGTAIRARQTLLLYYDRIIRFSKLVDMPANLMLALALVHEIGHLLLDSDEHSPTGIMRAEWGQSDLNAIRQSQLGFTTGQARGMKVNVERRRSTRPQ